MTRPRAADDFATIRARLQELRRERAPASPAGPDIGVGVLQPLGDAEQRMKERREGVPPPWAPTIFVQHLASDNRS